jgi:hypothetical protein
MRTVIILAALLSTTAADAASYGRTTTCARYGGSISCTTEGYRTGSYYSPGYAPASSVIDVAPPSAAELGAQMERERKWEAFCKPQANVDKLGVTRYSYAHEGCEFGRSE